MTNTRLNDLLIIKGLRLIVDRRLIQDITSPANLPFHPVTIPPQPWPRYGVFAPYALTREKAPSFEFWTNRCRQNHPRARRRHRGATETSTGARQKHKGAPLGFQALVWLWWRLVVAWGWLGGGCRVALYSGVYA